MTDGGRLTASGELERLGAERKRLESASHPKRLGVSVAAAAPEIRSAFLQAVKEFHPQRFARWGEAHQAAAGEIFHLIKEAHDSMMAALGSGDEKRKRRTSAPDKTGPVSAVRFRSESSKVETVRLPNPDAVPTAPMRPLVAKVPSSRSAESGPAEVSKTPQEPKAPQPTRRPDGRKLATVRPAATVGNAGRKAVVTDSRRHKNVPSEARLEFADHSGLVAQLESKEEEDLAAYRAANKLLRRGRAAEARTEFRALAIANPTDKRYRTYMHFAWGKEHELAGRNEQAESEYQRALNVEPTFKPALEALEALTALSAKPGVLSRFFGRK